MKKGKGRKLFDGKNYDTVVLKLETAWAMDCSDKEAASFAEISDSALCQFLKSHPDISKRKAQLKDMPIFEARESLRNSIKNGDGNLALKYLERKRKDEFAERKEVVIDDSKRNEWAKSIINNPELSDDISKLMGKIAKK